MDPTDVVIVGWVTGSRTVDADLEKVKAKLASMSEGQRKGFANRLDAVNTESLKALDELAALWARYNSNLPDPTEPELQQRADDFVGQSNGQLRAIVKKLERLRDFFIENEMSSS